MKPLTLLILVSALALPTRADADPIEDGLKRFFEGRTVILNLEMPASDDGVDVYPERTNPLDYAALAGRLKQNGTALFIGDQTMITKIKVKKDLIEFQLAGGGFGTFFDAVGPAVSIPDVPKSKREKFLEDAVRNEKNPHEKKRLELELAEERDAREAEIRYNQAAAARAEEVRRIYARQVALESGSRFNIRFERRVPASILTPEAIMTVLEPWVEFPWRTVAEAAPDSTATPVDLPELFAGLRKGLLMEDVEALMQDRPRAELNRYEGDLSVTDWVYDSSSGLVKVTFVEGVLVRYRFASDGMDTIDGRPEKLEPEKASFRRLR